MIPNKKIHYMCIFLPNVAAKIATHWYSIHWETYDFYQGIMPQRLSVGYLNRFLNFKISIYINRYNMVSRDYIWL